MSMCMLLHVNCMSVTVFMRLICGFSACLNFHEWIPYLRGVLKHVFSMHFLCISYACLMYFLCTSYAFFCFTCLWVLFMFLLCLYFRLDDIGKSASLLSSISVWSPCLAQFSHEKMSCSHSRGTWLNVRNQPPVRDHYQVDQSYHVSHLLVFVQPTSCCGVSVFIAAPPDLPRSFLLPPSSLLPRKNNSKKQQTTENKQYTHSNIH